MLYKVLRCIAALTVCTDCAVLGRDVLCCLCCAGFCGCWGSRVVLCCCCRCLTAVLKAAPPAFVPDRAGTLSCTHIER